jgi:hypothetical protein
MVPLGEARLSEEREREMRPRASVKPWPTRVRRQSVEATPNSRIVTRQGRSGRALRANRCAHVRRAWARSARESGAEVTVGVAVSAPSPGCT